MTDEKYCFLNRDLSWLSFNHRVLLEAADESVPLYNRISFLSIFSSNLDEFFRVRMPAIFTFSSLDAKKAWREEYPEVLADLVKTTVQEQLEQFGQILTQQVIPGLKREHIHLYYGEPVLEQHKETIRDFFYQGSYPFCNQSYYERRTGRVFFWRIMPCILFWILNLRVDRVADNMHY